MHAQWVKFEDDEIWDSAEAEGNEVFICGRDFGGDLTDGPHWVLLTTKDGNYFRPISMVVEFKELP